LQGARDIRANLFDDSGQLVAKDGRRSNHAGVIAALPDLEVGSASERDFHAHQRLVRRQPRNADTFDLQILAAVQYSGDHLRIRLGADERCSQCIHQEFSI
jgi:hypothetical protein